VHIEEQLGGIGMFDGMGIAHIGLTWLAPDAERFDVAPCLLAALTFET
jgi:hypothetical protein